LIIESAAVGGQPFDLETYGQLTDRVGRAFQRLGLKRVMHDVTPDLGAYLTATGPGNPKDGHDAITDLRSGNGRRRPTSSTGGYDAFRHYAPGLSDRHLLGATLGGDSWLAWRVLLIAAMGEPWPSALRLARARGNVERLERFYLPARARVCGLDHRPENQCVELARARAASVLTRAGKGNYLAIDRAAEHNAFSAGSVRQSRRDEEGHPAQDDDLGRRYRQ
jgi:hypothetical protein